ncbi:DEAD/DEAH box helicase [Radiobacillus sp. PE A8.2]|uniref:DEAD/DEAH box helicase n=1 Tax=Radiobacillus sp. PE A8.2 TaxID=3380349 RepID=UPI00388E9B1E
MGRVLACKPLYSWNGPEPAWEKHVDPCKWKGELSRYQHHASEQIASYISKGNKDLLVWAVAGAGKTEMLFEGLSQALQQGKRICIATPRTDVVRELLPRLRRAFPNVTIEGLYGGSPDKESRAQFIVATTHQLIRFNRAFDVIVIDEIDAFPFHMDQSLHFAAHRSAKEAAAKIYLTATPRAEHQKKVQAKTLDVVFVPQRFHGYPLPVPSFRLCLTLRKALATHHPPKAFFQWLDKREYPNRHVIIFVPTISLSEKLMQSLRNMEILQTNNHTYTIDYAHSADAEREQKINNFRNGNINMLITTTILERGVTFPSVDVAVLDAGHSVFDDAALIQIAGRAGRSHIDPTGEVVFFHDAKTDAMVRAVKSIEQMNRRRRKL